MRIMKRSEALRQGLPKYRTGRPCKHGHDSERYTLSGVCVQCVADQKSREREIFEQSRAENQGV